MKKPMLAQMIFFIWFAHNWIYAGDAGSYSPTEFMVKVENIKEQHGRVEIFAGLKGVEYKIALQKCEKDKDFTSLALTFKDLFKIVRKVFSIRADDISTDACGCSRYKTNMSSYELDAEELPCCITLTIHSCTKFLQPWCEASIKQSYGWGGGNFYILEASGAPVTSIDVEQDHL
jgi:hypothetical protein